jgi:hypothetical protein
MNDTAYAQQEAIAQRRHGQHRVSGWAQFRCVNVRCPAQEINVYIEEDADTKPFQAPNKCIRCNEVLTWEGWGQER